MKLDVVVYDEQGHAHGFEVSPAGPLSFRFSAKHCTSFGWREFIAVRLLNLLRRFVRYEVDVEVMYTLPANFDRVSFNVGAAVRPRDGDGTGA